MPGTLYVVGTPIGHLDDITLRALEILKSVDFIACENKSRHLKLLNHYQIKKRLLEYSPANEVNSAKGIVKLLEEGNNVALVSDAGTPGLSDPGRVLTDSARKASIPVIPVPGVSALTALLSVSGFSSNRVIFLGFPSKKEGKLVRELEEFSGMDCVVVLFCNQYNIKKILGIIKHYWENAEMIIGREMTKANEEYLRGTPEELLAADVTEKGEFTLAVKLMKKRSE